MAVSDNAIYCQTQNLSFVLEKVHALKFEDRPIPKLTSPYDVLVNVKFTGICGSDVSAAVSGVPMVSYKFGD